MTGGSAECRNENGGAHVHRLPLRRAAARWSRGRAEVDDPFELDYV